MSSETQAQDLSVVRQIALSVSKEHRALLQGARPQDSDVTATKNQNAKPTVCVGPTFDHKVPPQASFVPQYQPTGTDIFRSLTKVALDLEYILFIEEGDLSKRDTTYPLLKKIMDGEDSRPVLCDTQQVPELTEEQVRLAFYLIPADYGTLNCWTCRDERHSTFTSTYLTSTKRVFFSYRYYRHQIE